MPAQVADPPAAVADQSKKQRAESEVHDKTSSWVVPAGRIGLATQGVLYAIVGVLALQVASGHGEDQPSQTGAIQTVADQPFGKFLLVVLVVGLALHAAWRFMLAARGDIGPDDTSDVVKRLAQFGRGLIYAGFTVVAIKLLLDAGGGNSNTQQQATATALDWPGGQIVVIVVGIAVIADGIWNVIKGVRRSFEDNLDLSQCSPAMRKAVLAVGCAGTLARGIVFGLVGWFLVYAGVTYDPNESGGLDETLKKVADADNGPMVLRLLSIGLMLFGIYRLLDARYRKVNELANS